MPIEMGLPKYFKYSECEEGDKLVVKGEFIGVTQGKFGSQFNFLQLDDNQHVVLNKAGSLEWRVEQNHMVEGDVVDITFGGKEKLERGQYAGKEANTFTFAKYQDHELPADFVAQRNAKRGISTPPPAVSSAPATSNEALDSLE